MSCEFVWTRVRDFLSRTEPMLGGRGRWTLAVLLAFFHVQFCNATPIVTAGVPNGLVIDKIKVWSEKVEVPMFGNAICEESNC